MKYSLINVLGHKGGKVWGAWVQDHTGTFVSAKKAAEAIEAVNGNKIKIAVVEAVASACPHGKYFYDLDEIQTA